MMQAIAIWLMTGEFASEISGTIFSVVRKYGTTLRKTVVRDFDKILFENGLYFFIKINKTEKTYSFGGRVVEFFGADDEQKLRGSTRDFLYCNEANELNFLEEFHQLNVRTRKRVFLDFNPDDEDIWINTEIEKKRFHEKKDVEIIVSTYKNNPFLTKVEVDEIEYLKNVDDMLWQVYGKGEYGKIQGLIFPNVQIVPKIPDGARHLAYGIDWGFTHDPTAVVNCFLFDGALYIDELIYERGLQNPDIAQKMKDEGVPTIAEIIADSSEPKSIAELKSLGFRSIRGAEKGPDSVNFGISCMKQQPIFCTARSTGFQKESRKYKWAVDKSGNSLNKPIDKENHSCDAVRYVVIEKIGLNRNMGKYQRIEQDEKPLNAGIRKKTF